MTPEGRVKAMVNRELKKLRRLYRFCPVQNGMGAPALDYFLCAGGSFIAIETKAKGKTLTDRQEATAEAIEGAGGLVLVVDDTISLKEAIRIIRNCCMGCSNLLARC